MRGSGHLCGGLTSGAVFVLGLLFLAGCGSDQEATGGGGGGGGTTGSTGSGGTETPKGWAKRFGDPAHQDEVTIAVAPDEGIVLAGGFAGAIDFGGGPLQAAGGVTPEEDIYVAKLDAGGNHLWSKRAGDVAQQGNPALTVDGTGNVLLTGKFLGSLDFGGGPLVAELGGSFFVVKLDAAGTQVWAKTFSTSQVDITGVAVDGAGNVILAGGLLGTVDFGGGPLVNESGGSEVPHVVLVKLDAAGAHVWSKKFGTSTAVGLAQDVALDGAGNVSLTGWAYGAIDFGGDPVAGGMQTSSFLVKLDGAGNHVYSKAFGDDDNRVQFTLSVDAEDNLLAAGILKGNIDLGGQSLTSADSAPVVTRWNPAGQLLAGKVFPVGATMLAAAGAAGHVHLTGCADDDLDLGGAEPLPTSGNGTDVFLAELDADLSFVSGEVFADLGLHDEVQCGTTIASTPSGALVLGGYMAGSVDLGHGPVESAGGTDVFVMARKP